MSKPQTTQARVLRLAEEPNMSRLIEVAKFGAKTDNVTVIIERRLAGRVTPLAEITPDGQVKSIPNDLELRPTLGERFNDQFIDAHDVRANKRFAAGTKRFAMLMRQYAKGRAA